MADKSLTELLRELKGSMVTNAVDEERYKREANHYFHQVVHHPAYQNTPLNECIGIFRALYEAGLSWAPHAKHVSLMTNEEGRLTPYVHYKGQIRLAGAKGVIERVTADLLYGTDDFEFLGAHEMPKIRRKLTRSGLGEAIGGYTVSHLQNGQIHVEVFDVEALNKAEEAGVSNGNGEFWNGPHRREMQRKSLINATASRWLELSYTLKTANQ
ncbi:recombinase RecT [Aeromonas caviae]|uniref:Recombinase RecT n=1 Tax=Aeromonas caviae TaxID=648 RepID=A0AA42RC50_AERCA|nr:MULTISPECIES: recombinase RecT [Aeromonas]MDH0436543.1 recombinase RecT [Aeromonas caviae]MDH0477417.1 recombinase RecT [Aeromonas caviae]MDH0939130.1 recombinase RecT [Aeromonas caviae]MDH1400019.1 recombinase RecT [Aeromonas caviae]MDH1507843.1 recombinase RecT [Aeromonas caviae]